MEFLLIMFCLVVFAFLCIIIAGAFNDWKHHMAIKKFKKASEYGFRKDKTCGTSYKKKHHRF